MVEAMQEGDAAVLEQVEKSQIEFRSTFKSDFERMERLIVEAKYDVLKWTVPLILGLYGLIIFKLF